MAASSSTDPPDQNVVTPLFGETFTDVGQDYSLGKRLGSGNFAKVVLGELEKAKEEETAKLSTEPSNCTILCMKNSRRYW